MKLGYTVMLLSLFLSSVAFSETVRISYQCDDVGPIQSAEINFSTQYGDWNFKSLGHVGTKRCRFDGSSPLSVTLGTVVYQGSVTSGGIFVSETNSPCIPGKSWADVEIWDGQSDPDTCMNAGGNFVSSTGYELQLELQVCRKSGGRDNVEAIGGSWQSKNKYCSFKVVK